MNDKEKIEKALDLAYSYGQIDGAHHKMWVIDQMVRVLLNSPTIVNEAIDSNDEPYVYRMIGKSPEYKEWIKEYEEDDEYEWDEGIAP